MPERMCMLPKKKKRVDVVPTSRRYSDEEKLKIATFFGLSQNLLFTAAKFDVPLDTLKIWKKTTWWQEAAETALENSRRVEVVDAGEIIDIARREMKDRILNGNPVYDRKTGRIVRVPVPLKELSAAVQSTDKVRGEAEKKLEGNVVTQSIEQKLKALAEALQGKAPVDAQKEIDEMNKPLTLENEA